MLYILMFSVSGSRQVCNSLKQVTRSISRIISIVTRPQARQLSNHGLIPCQGFRFFLKCPDQTWCSLVTYSTGPGGSFSTIEWLEHEAHQSPQSNAVVKNEGNHFSTPLYAFMGCTWTGVLYCIHTL